MTETRLKGHDKKLTVKQRREIVLSSLRGEKHLDLAQRYGINPGTVTYFLKKARTAPKKQLEEAMEEVLFRALVVAALEVKPPKNKRAFLGAP